MIRIIVFGVLVLVLIWTIQSRFPARRKDTEIDDSEMVLDPNCGTYVLKKTAVTRTVSGQQHYFCGERCAGEFASKKT